MGTIVQEYGPFYGEQANGSVQGRPNGSIYVPPTNTISLSVDALYIDVISDTVVPTDDQGNMISGAVKIAASVQDPASFMAIGFYSDPADTTTQIGYSPIFTAGIFNVNDWTALSYYNGTLTTGTKYYARGLLLNNWVIVAMSDPVELEAL